jgi:hypothetical protein
MTTVQQHLVAKKKKPDRTHLIVMTAVVAVALISATAALVAGSASSTLLSAPRHEVITVDAHASEAPVMPLSLGYLEFDWSTALDLPPVEQPSRALARFTMDNSRRQPCREPSTFRTTHLNVSTLEPGENVVRHSRAPSELPLKNGW